MAEKKTTESVFSTLQKISVKEHIEKKNGLSYVSWAWAWAYVKEVYPNAFYTIYERETEYGPVNYFTDGKTCWVKTGVTIEGQEHIEDLPVMNYQNKSILLKDVTSMDVNKAIQRSLTKACARHGLGLSIYAGEDLPLEINTDAETPQPAPQPAPQPVDDPQLKEAFEILKPEIDNAPSRDYLNMLHANNPALHNYGPYRTLMNSRFKQVK